MKRQWGTIKLALLLVVPALSLVLGAAALTYLHVRYQQDEAASRAREVADVELRRLTSTMNYRLNDLREELFHLYTEQLNLAKALGEVERERLLFFRRDHLAAFAVFVRGTTNNWQLQKYYLRPGSSKPALEVLKSSVVSMNESGYLLKRTQASAFNVPGQSTATQSDVYIAAFLHNDDAGRPFVLVGAFRPSYTFPFCRLFGDHFGAMPVSAFVLDERGHVVCHSQSRFESADFSKYAMKEGSHRYINAAGVQATALVKSATPEGLLLVAEATEVNPWQSIVPLRALIAVAALVLLITVVCAVWLIFSLKRLFVLGPRAANVVLSPETFAVQDGAPTVGLNEFTKLRRELKDLEATLLDLQSQQAFVAGFQKKAVDLSAGEDLGRFAVDYLAPWSFPVVWCPASADGRAVSCGPFNGFEKALKPFHATLENYNHPNDLAQNGEVLKQLRNAIKKDELLIQPVYCHEKLLGLLVVVGLERSKDVEKVKVLPQLAQIMGFVMQAKVTQVEA